MNNINKEVYWYTLNQPSIQKLQKNSTCNVVIIGGGMAGLMAAQAWAQKGKSVILLEQSFCGSGASGKSSGFISPDSELELYNYIELFGIDGARALWEFGQRGVDAMRLNIEKYSLSCDMQEQQSLYIASNKNGYEHIMVEYKARKQLGYQAELYDATTIKNIIHSDLYYGGVTYNNCFGMTSYLYCQALKEKLIQEYDIAIYENTAAQTIHNATVTTNEQLVVNADTVVIAADYALTKLGYLQGNVYHAQTFLAITKPLSQQQIQAIFPASYYMVWDTQLVFNYFRLTRENRLLIGGATLLSTYAQKQSIPSNAIINKLQKYCTTHFPEAGIEFDYIWSGLIGISKDFIPLAGTDNKNPHVYYISAAAGLPWAASLGIYSAEHMLEGRDDLDAYFSPQRHFTVPIISTSTLATQVSFAIANFIEKFIK